MNAAGREERTVSDPLTCPRCGSVYRGAAVERLPWVPGRVDRVDGVVRRYVACLCETTECGRAALGAGGMPLAAGDTRAVIVVREVLGIVLSEHADVVLATPRRLVVRMHGRRVSFDRTTLRAIGERGSITPEEMAAGLRIAERSGG